MEVGVIDLYTPFEGKADLLPDGVHPNAEGATLIAVEIHKELNKIYR
jgi:acyl-CoA thioesterase I